MDERLKKVLLKFKLKQAVEKSKKDKETEDRPLNFKQYTEEAATE